MILQEHLWRHRQLAHANRIQPWVRPRLERRQAGLKHPVDDFLFDYYPYSIHKLSTWHPGFGVTLAGEADEFLVNPAYHRAENGITLDPVNFQTKGGRLELVIRLLGGTQSRPPQLNCFGLHEWAMVYSSDEVRHDQYQLRLSNSQVAETVEDLGLRCTHIDAFRFFTEEAKPQNACEPTRESQPELEQPGCLHANMDLYKYAMWFSPFIGSDLVADCFALARSARELDMRAAPYDLVELGYQPIRVETPQGRAEYVQGQRNITGAAQPLRSRLLSELTTLRGTK